MGSLFKHQSVRWVDSEGSRVKSKTPGAKKVIEKSRKWWGSYRDAFGKLVKKPLFKDKQSSQLELANLERLEDRRKAGLWDDHIEQAGRPLAEHIAEWLASLEQSGVSRRRIEDLTGRINKLISMAKWERLNDITEESLLVALRKLNVGVQTRNHYLQHVKQFVHWSVPDRLPSNPIGKLKRQNVNCDRRHDRRELTPQEQEKLISTTRESSVMRFKLNGRSRALLYQLAFATGFRRGELRSLTAESFDLDAEIPCVTVAAGYSKHRKQDNQPLPNWIVERLREWFASGGQLWPKLTKHTAKMLKGDLEAAGIAYVVRGPDGPLYADFHSTRHTFVTSVSRTQAPLKDMMEMTRHGTPELLLNVYAKTNQENKARLVQQLSDPCPDRPNT